MSASPGRRVAILIPARYASSRYPGKPLALLEGATGLAKPLIRRSWEAACLVPRVDAVAIATDDARIADTARAFGANVIMTPASCANGTERCAAALAALPAEIDVIVNLQGDALLTPAHFITALTDRMAGDPGVAVATPAMRCTPDFHRGLLKEQTEGRVGGTTVVRDRHGDALYFSKRVLPHVPSEMIDDPDTSVYFHVGVYAYRRDALTAYAAMPSCPLEALEGLEQLRFLDGGIKVAVVQVDAEGADIWELNNPSDTPRIEAALAARGIV